MRVFWPLLCAGAFVALGAQPCAAQARGLQVTPVVIEVEAERGVSSFRLRNGRAEETAFEVEVFEWRQEDGETVLAPTTDAIVAPTVFLTPAGGEQIVRVGVATHARPRHSETAYRIIVREVPVREREDLAGFRLQIEMSMPLFVRPRGARGNLAVEALRDVDGQRFVRLRNTGSAHLNLAHAAGAPMVEDLPRYLLPGAVVTRPVLGEGFSLPLLIADDGSDLTQRLFDLSNASLADLGR